MDVFRAVLFCFALLAVQTVAGYAGLDPEPLDIIDNTDWIED